ncbi:MAG: molybdenum ABC transporter ATP-binding protein [Spirochaetota bacterium]
MELSFNLKKKFGVFSLDINYSAHGNRTGVFGPSGSGKSTLVNLLAGLEHPDSGFISLDGETLFNSSEHISIPSEHRRIGIVFQQPHLFPHLSVKKNLLYGFKRCKPEYRKISLEDILDVLQIGKLLDRSIANLSGGEKQRVAIGRAVLSNPRLLIMDEPLTGLDDKLKFQIIPFVKKICEIFNIPYIFISHSILEMMIMTDCVLPVSEGRTTGNVTPEGLALIHMEDSAGYMNLLKLKNPRMTDGMFAYKWGSQDVLVADGSDSGESLFQILSTDIILFKRHPEAISARNLFKCIVKNVFQSGHRLGVELECGGEKLIAEIVKESADELGIREGAEIFAAMKAVSFRRLI